MFQDMVDRVVVHSGHSSDDLADLASDAPQKLSRAGVRSVSRLLRKDPVEISLVGCRPVASVVSPLPPVMLSQCLFQSFERINLTPGQALRRFSRQIPHNLLDIVELSFRSPSCVLPPPLCPGPQPDRKSTRLNSSHSQISYAV